jgi:hypothetical protein
MQQQAQTATKAKTGLAEALANLGGAHRVGGVAARNAYSPGLDVAMVVGAIIVAATTIAVYVALPSTRKVTGRQAHLTAPSPTTLEAPLPWHDLCRRRRAAHERLSCRITTPVTPIGARPPSATKKCRVQAPVGV